MTSPASSLLQQSKSKTLAFKRTIKKLLEAKLIECTLPNAVQSRLQKYQLSKQSRKIKATFKNKNRITNRIPK